MEEDHLATGIHVLLREFLPSLRGRGPGVVHGAPAMTAVAGEEVVEEWVVSDIVEIGSVLWFDYLLVWRLRDSDKMWTTTWRAPVPTGTPVDDVIGVMVS